MAATEPNTADLRRLRRVGRGRVQAEGLMASLHVHLLFVQSCVAQHAPKAVNGQDHAFTRLVHIASSVGVGPDSPATSPTGNGHASGRNGQTVLRQCGLTRGNNSTPMRSRSVWRSAQSRNDASACRETTSLGRSLCKSLELELVGVGKDRSVPFILDQARPSRSQSDDRLISTVAC